MRVEEQVHEQRLDRGAVVADPVIARRLRPAQFQAVERALSREWGTVGMAGRELAREHGHHRVVAELVVVGQVLVAERDAEHALHQQYLDRVGRREAAT